MSSNDRWSVGADVDLTSRHPLCSLLATTDDEQLSDVNDSGSMVNSCNYSSSHSTISVNSDDQGDDETIDSCGHRSQVLLCLTDDESVMSHEIDLTRPDQPLKPVMATKRRASVRTRMKAEDVSSWVDHNQVWPVTGLETTAQQQATCEEVPHVRFNVPAPSSDDELETGSLESIAVLPVPLDGGYGWAICFYSFMMHLILDGSSFCFGKLYVEIQKSYGVSRVGASLTASAFLSLPLLLSVVAGLFSDIWGCKASIIFGSLVCCSSCVISIICPNVWLFTIVFGFGGGFGMSYMYNAAIAIVTYYFNKKRGFATAVAVSGTGVGTLAYSFYMDFVSWILTPLLSKLTTMLIAYALGFFVISVIGFAIEDCEWTSDTHLFKLRKFEKKLKAFREELETKSTVKGLSRHAISLPNLNIAGHDPGSIRSMCDVGNENKRDMPARSKSVALFENEHPMPTIPEYSMLNTRLANLEHLDLELANSPCHTVKASRKRVTSKISMSVDQINEMEEEDFKINILTSTESCTETGDESSSDDSELSNDGDSSSSELSEKHPDPSAKLLNTITPNFTRASSSAPNSARINRQSIVPGTGNMYGGRIMASNAYQGHFTSNLLKMGKVPSAPMLVMKKKKNGRFFNNGTFTDFWSGLKEERQRIPTVMENRAFKWIVLSVFFLYLVLDVPYVCFYDFALDKLNLPESSADTIYSFIGVTNIIFTLIFGKLADVLPLRRHLSLIYAFSMVIAGLSIVSAIFVENQWSLICCSVTFGASVTANYALQSIFVTICFGDVAVFQPAYSLVSMVGGIASFIGPMIFGPLRDISGGFTQIFIVGLICCVLSAACMLKFQQVHMEEEAEKEKKEILRQDALMKKKWNKNQQPRSSMEKNGITELELHLLA